MEKPDVNVSQVAIEELKPDPNNANSGTERGREMLRWSLQELLAGRGIVLDKKDRIIAGNKTTEVAQEVGIDDVIVVESDGSKLVAVKRTDLDLTDENDPRARLMAYADNRVAQEDLMFAAEVVKADKDAGLDLGKLWTEPELRNMFDKAGLIEDSIEDPGAQVDRAEDLRQKWDVRSGDLWQLGEHRLVCGDCTDRAVVERVMGGEKARLCFTSPPYADQREYEIGDFDWLALANGFMDAVPIGGPGDILVNLGLSHKEGRVNRYWDDWLAHCESAGYPLFGWYVWDKGSGFPGDYHGRLASAHEFVFHFSISHERANKWIPTTGRGASGNRFRQKDGTLKEVGSPDSVGQLLKIPDSVIRITRETARSIHTQSTPAVFPVEFPEFGIQTWSDPGAIVYEPFSGSGTTIIACERLNRKCRAVEISPGYCAVAIERWATAIGKTPVLLERLEDQGDDSGQDVASQGDDNNQDVATNGA